MNDRAFTLPELLIAMVMLAIIIAIAGGRAYNGAKQTAYLAAMQSDLRNLAGAQEAYYDDAGGNYAPTLKVLEFQPSPGVSIRIRGATNGWSARAEHKNLKADKFYCAILIGDVQPFLPAEEEGVIECDPRKTKNKKKKKK